MAFRRSLLKYFLLRLFRSQILLILCRFFVHFCVQTLSKIDFYLFCKNLTKSDLFIFDYKLKCFMGNLFRADAAFAHGFATQLIHHLPGKC